MTNQHRILILFAHPTLHRSVANKKLLAAANAFTGVTVVDLYGEYPTFQIDIELEQQRLREHDVIIFMFPLYWYSTPSILKEWQDLVLEYGFAYGNQGSALQDKIFLCAITAGGAEKAYHSEGYNHFTLRELLQPLEQMATITGMKYLPPLALFSARTAAEENRMDAHVNLWRVLLSALLQETIDLGRCAQQVTINGYVRGLLEVKS